MSSTREHPLCRIESDDGILVYRYTMDSHIDLLAAREIVVLGTELANGERMPTLIDLGGVKKVDREARAFFAESSQNRAITLRAAMLIHSPISQMLGNFFLGLNKPDVPTKLFTRESDAIEWLRQ